MAPRHRFQESVAPSSFSAHPAQGEIQAHQCEAEARARRQMLDAHIADQQPRPQPTSLFFDRLTWGPEELRAAAAVQGTEAGFLMQIIRDNPRHQAILETERLAVRLAIEAFHYASRAIELEWVESGTLRGVVR